MKTIKPYIRDPKTIEEAAYNVIFQCENVSGWLYVKDYKSAMIKAKCLVEDLEVVLKMQENEVVDSKPGLT